MLPFVIFKSNLHSWIKYTFWINCKKIGFHELINSEKKNQYIQLSSTATSSQLLSSMASLLRTSIWVTGSLTTSLSLSLDSSKSGEHWSFSTRTQEDSLFASPLSDCSSSLISLATFSDIPALTFDLLLTSSAVELVELKELEDEDLTLSTSISGTNLAESSAIKI